ncbi:TonB-dependent receptor [Sphingomonas sp. J344]|uniref:TonB-dependent receptor n=1 Tax=Sphingomonas sp. J344 TaxID=2898434 RepID=UPI002150AFE5|nr:TonB-dependent receptor [Sphingomonas sp. J344]MCR5872407.1 TonB-dependent receptor [Sphingomonas sp. J344]
MRKRLICSIGRRAARSTPSGPVKPRSRASCSSCRVVCSASRSAQPSVGTRSTIRPARSPVRATHGGASTSGITAGSSKTWEAFGEINVPLLKDLPFVHELSLSAAGRVTNVTSTRTSDGFSDSDNGNWTYKLGGNWAPTEWFRVRGSYGTSFRSPALFEQFLANETSFQFSRNIDPCAGYTNGFLTGRINQRQRDNCIAQGIPATYNGSGVSATVSSQGGIGQLEAETSKAFVIGGVLTPRLGFLGSRTRINIAVDYFDIKVSGQVAQLGAASIIFGCYDSASFPTDPLCSLFTRGQTGAPFNINTVSDQYINIASQQNSGVDLTANVRSDLGAWGNISFTADMTWQTRDTFQLLPTSPIQTDNGEAGSPRWVGDFRLTWNLPSSGTTLFYGMNVIGATSNVDEFLADNNGNPCINGDRGDGVAIRGIYCPVLTTNATFYHNASITQEVADKFEITLGVSNLFNTRPPRVSVLNGGQISMLGPVVAASQYSFVGRRAFINVSAKF